MATVSLSNTWNTGTICYRRHAFGTFSANGNNMGKAGNAKRKAQFLERFWLMANDPRNEFVTWSKDGTCVQIKEGSSDSHFAASCNLLPKSQNMKTFKRRLNAHGFRTVRPKVTTKEHKGNNLRTTTVSHPCFLRDRPDLLKHVISGDDPPQELSRKTQESYPDLQCQCPCHGGGQTGENPGLPTNTVNSCDSQLDSQRLVLVPFRLTPMGYVPAFTPEQMASFSGERWSCSHRFPCGSTEDTEKHDILCHAHRESKEAKQSPTKLVHPRQNATETHSSFHDNGVPCVQKPLPVTQIAPPSLCQTQPATPVISHTVYDPKPKTEGERAKYRHIGV